MVIHGVRVDGEAGDKLLRNNAAPINLAPFENQNALPCLGQVARERETVMAAADNEEVVSFRGPTPPFEWRCQLSALQVRQL